MVLEFEMWRPFDVLQPILTMPRWWCCWGCARKSGNCYGISTIRKLDALTIQKKDQFAFSFFRPRRLPRTFLNCFALEVSVWVNEDAFWCAAAYIACAQVVVLLSVCMHKNRNCFGISKIQKLEAWPFDISMFLDFWIMSR